MRAVRFSHLVVAALVGMCLLISSSVASATTPAGRPPPPPERFKTARVAAAGLSLRYPAAWAVLPLTQKDLAAAIQRLAKTNPKLDLPRSPDQQADLLLADKFFAIDVDPSSVYSRGTATVAVDDFTGFPANLAEFTSMISAGYQQQGATLLHASSSRVGEEPAYRADARAPVTGPDGQTIVVREGVLFVPHGDGTAIVGVGVADSPAGASLIDAVLRSVHHL